MRVDHPLRPRRGPHGRPRAPAGALARPRAAAEQRRRGARGRDDGRTAIEGVAVESARSIAGGATTALLFGPGDGARMRAARRGRRRDPRRRPGAARRRARRRAHGGRRAAGARAAPGGRAARARRPGALAHATAVRIAPRGGAGRRARHRRRRAGPRESVLAALRALATQVALALDSAALTEEVHRRSSEARFGSLVQHSSDLITVLGPDGEIIYQSPSIERVLGYSPDGGRRPPLRRPGRRRATASASPHLVASGATGHAASRRRPSSAG